MGCHRAKGDFTKITKVLFSKLREQGYLNASHLDDSFLTGEDIPDCRQNIISTVAIG